MEVLDYSKESYAIVGDTKPWKEDIKAMGGKFNSYLKGQDGQSRQAGWVIAKSRVDFATLDSFIQDANSGAIEPPPTQRPAYTRRVASPRAPTSPSPISRPAPASPRATASPVVIPRPAPTSPSVIPRPAPSIISRPVSRFSAPTPKERVDVTTPSARASDGLIYQTVTYTVVQPVVGQKFYLNLEGDQMESGTVVSINSTSPVDKMTIQLDGSDEQILAAVIAGKWAIPDFQERHNFVFHRLA